MNIEATRFIHNAGPMVVDLASVLVATKIPILFLDKTLHIAWYTPSVRELMRVIAGDIGRDLRDIMPRIVGLDLVRECREVVRDAKERELHVTRLDEDGPPRTFMLRILPFLRGHGEVDGVLLVSADVTSLDESNQMVRALAHGDAIGSSLGLELASRSADLLCSEAVRRVEQHLQADAVELSICLPDGESLLVWEAAGFPSHLTAEAIVRADEHGTAGFALRSRTPVLSVDFELENRFGASSLLETLGLESGIACVVQTAETAFGVLSVYSRRKRAFYQNDANVLQSIADVLASAMARERASTCIEMERTVARILGEARSLDDALNGIADAFIADLGIALVEHWVAADGWLERTLVRAQPHIESHPAAASLGVRRPVHEDHVACVAWTKREPRWLAVGRQSGDPAADLQLRAGFAVPIVAEDRPVGVMSFFTKDRMLPSDLLMQTLGVIGRKIAAFIARVETEQRAEHFAQLVRACGDAITSIDRGGKIDTWNRGAERIYGYTAREMVGSSFLGLFEKEAQASKFMERIERAELLQPMVVRHRTHVGDPIDVSLTASRVKGADGRLQGWALVARNVSIERRTEERLVEADRQKDQFLMMLGHELRNPLGAIRSAAELLKMFTASDERAQRSIAIVERQCAHMISLVEGLLDVARIAHGKLKLEPEALELNRLLKDLLADREAQVAQGSIELSTDFEKGALRIVADRTRISQVFDNLISNAIKFTAAGGAVAISARSQGDRAIVRIKDTGIGIAQEQREGIFRPFVQLRTEARATGLGLGLALTKLLVELHGGTIDVESEGVGKGACFEVRLPLDHDRVFPEAALKPPQRILIVEDDDDGGLMMARLLRLSGYEVSAVGTGEEAIEVASATHPDVVLCDIELPGLLDGYDVARRLRANPEMKDVALIGVTGYGQAEHDRAAGDSDFDAHLTKPAALDDIERTIEELTH